MNLPAHHPDRNREHPVEARVRCLTCERPSVRFTFEGLPLDPCRFCGGVEFKRLIEREL